MDKNGLKIAIVGATGMVGGMFLQVLSEKNIKGADYVLFASCKSAGKVVDFLGKPYTVVELNDENIKKYKVDIALFSAGGATSARFAPVFVECGSVVIDNSSHWRMDKNVPLVVPQVNASAAKTHNGIIANPNCSTIQAVVALNPLHKAFGLKRVVYSTYQAVSGAGIAGWNDLNDGVQAYANNKPTVAPKKFTHPIFNNIIPHIDVFLPSGYTKEEEKMIAETRKILDAPNLKITATTARVPVFNGHSESINAEFERRCDLNGIFSALKNQAGLVVLDDPANNIYPMPINANGRDEVFVGRIRLDESVDSGINMWVVSDNIRKGAATNAVEILECLIK